MPAHPLGVLTTSGFLIKDEDLLQRRPVLRLANPVVRLHQLVTTPRLAAFDERKAQPAWRTAEHTVGAQILGSAFEQLAREWTSRHASTRTLGGANRASRRHSRERPRRQTTARDRRRGTERGRAQAGPQSGHLRHRRSEGLRPRPAPRRPRPTRPHPRSADRARGTHGEREAAALRTHRLRHQPDPGRGGAQRRGTRGSAPDPARRVPFRLRAAFRRKLSARAVRQGPAASRAAPAAIPWADLPSVARLYEPDGAGGIKARSPPHEPQRLSAVRADMSEYQVVRVSGHRPTVDEGRASRGDVSETSNHLAIATG